MKRTKAESKVSSLSSRHTEMSERAANKLREAAAKDAASAYALMESSEEGLSEADAKERISKFGLNEVEYDRAPSWFSQLVKSFINPFIFILLAIVIISFGIDVWFAAPGEKDFKTVVVVSVMILISALLSFFQEFRSNRAAEKLKSMVKTTATVLRKESGKTEVEMKYIVPGDIFFYLQEI